MVRRILTATLGALAITAAPMLALPGAAVAADQSVDLELVLAVDVSGSVDIDEAKLQRDGYVAALTHPDVVAAIANGMLGRIAVAYVEWAGFAYKTVVVEWRLIDDGASARTFATTLASAPLTTGMWTSISGVIEFALPMFADNGFDGTRRAIDISGDGANNNGRLVTRARDEAVAAGIAINGLPIVNDRLSPFGFPQIPNLDRYYYFCVIGGPGAFVVVAAGPADFATAIRRKLILEIAGRTPGSPLRRRATQGARGLVLAALAGPDGLQRTSEAYPPGCDIGERRFREFRRRWDQGPP